MAGDGQFDTHSPTYPCDFSKNVSPRDSVKPQFLLTFNIIISLTFAENFMDIPQVF